MMLSQYVWSAVLLSAILCYATLPLIDESFRWDTHKYPTMRSWFRRWFPIEVEAKIDPLLDMPVIQTVPPREFIFFFIIKGSMIEMEWRILHYDNQL